MTTIITVVVCMVAAFYCGMIHERSRWVDLLVRMAHHAREIRAEHIAEVERLPR